MALASFAVILLVLWTLLAYVAIPLPFQDPFFAWVRRQWLMEGLAVLTGLGIVSLAISAWRQPSRGDPPWWRVWVVWLCWAVVGALISIDRGTTARACVAYGSYGLLAFIVSRLIRGPSDLSLWLRFLVGVGVIVCGEGLVQYVRTFDVTLPLMRQLQASGQLDLRGWGGAVIQDFLIRKRIFSVFGWPNLFAGFLLLMFPMAVGLARDASAPRGRIGWGLAGGLLGLCLLLTLSMGAWIAAVLTAAIVWGLMRAVPRSHVSQPVGRAHHPWARGLVVAALAVGLICVTSFIVAKRARPLIFASTLSRFVYVQGACHVLRARPLTGTGLGTFGLAYQALKPHEPFEGQHNALHAHNTVLEMGADVGGIGLLFFLMFLWRVWQMSTTHIRMATRESGAWLRWGVAVGLVGFFVHSLLEQTFVEAITAPFWWIALGLLTGVSSWTPPQRRRGLWPLLASGCVIVSLSLWWAVADGWAARGAWLDLAGRPAEAMQSFEKAAHYDALETRYPLEQGERLFKRATTQPQEQETVWLERAQQQFTRTVTLSPWLGYAWFRLGQVQAQLGHVDQAVAAMREAVRRDPNSRQVRLELIQLLGTLGRFEESRQVAIAYQRLEPSDPRGWFWEAVAWQHLQQLDQAQAAYEYVLQRFPTYYPAFFNLAELSRMRGRSPEAIQYYRAFLQAAPPQDQQARQAASAALATLRAN